MSAFSGSMLSQTVNEPYFLIDSIEDILNYKNLKPIVILRNEDINQIEVKL